MCSSDLNSFGCSATAFMTDTVHVYANPPHPTILIAGDTLKCLLAGYSYQWLLNDSVVAGETQAFIVPQITGNYSIVISTIQGCSDTSQVLFFTVTGINTQDGFASDVIIYPNPANGTLHIEYFRSGVALIRLSDATNKLVYEKEISSGSSRTHETIDVSALEKGIYFLEFKSGGRTLIRKIAVN